MRTALGAWQIDGEGRAFSGAALDGDPASVVLGHVPHYGEAQARSAGSLGAGLVHPVETLEDARDLPLRDADAGVGDANRYLWTFGAPDHLDPAPWRRVLHRIIYKIGEHRGQLCLVAVDGELGRLAEAFPLEADFFLAGDASHACEHGHQDAAHVDAGGVVERLLALEACQVEEVRYEVGEPFGLLFELGGEEAGLDGILIEGLLQALGQ